MFDTHIQYFCYNNTEGDEFGVGHLGNKEFWLHLINSWNRNDGRKERVHLDDWDELDYSYDLRGCVLAEVVPDDQEYTVFWLDDQENENMVRITHDNKLVWENEPDKSSSIPRWVNRL
jgi:hypothetical protein